MYKIPLPLANRGTFVVVREGERAYLASNGYGESGTGAIRSPAFTLAVPRITVLMRGWRNRLDPDSKSLNLLDARTGEVLARAWADVEGHPLPASLEVSAYQGREVLFELLDRDGYGYTAWIGVETIDAGTFQADFARPGELDRWTYCQLPVTPVEREGIPFDARGETVLGREPYRVAVERRGGCLALLGMTLPDAPLYAGDHLGDLLLEYADGVREAYPLTVGEALWWGDRFHTYFEPFVGYEEPRRVLWNSLRLAPCRPVTDEEGYVLAIPLRGETLTALAYEPAMEHAPIIRGATLLAETPPALWDRVLLPRGVEEEARAARLQAVQDLLYVSEANFPQAFSPSLPEGYRGPLYRFEGDRYAQFYTNVIHYNIEDAAAKVDADGTQHTSTLGAPWYGYEGIGGTFTPDGRIYPDQQPGFYYAECWSRDMGRSLMELIRFGRSEHAEACLDWCLAAARVWEEREDLRWKGQRLPRHIQRILQRYETNVGNGCFENDGQFMVALFLWTLWKRQPNRVQWARERWEDIAGLGDWFLWQFAHPEISGATDVLWSDSESSGWPFKVGPSLYVDVGARESLYALAEIADALGEAEKARAWRSRADALRAAIERNYLGETAEGLAWCRQDSWDGQTNLAPIILPCDRLGLDVPRIEPEWLAYNRAAGAVNRRNFVPGAAMGYCQAFTLQAALLLDAMEDAARFLRQDALMIYNPVEQPYIIPESARQLRPGVFTRTGDLGNCVQQAEILKALRIIVGVDDAGDSLRLIPRLPAGWTGASVAHYPAYFGQLTAELSCAYTLTQREMTLRVEADRPLPAVRFRAGPFAEPVGEAWGLLDGRAIPAREEQSGDAYWIWLEIPAGLTAFAAQAGFEDT